MDVVDYSMILSASKAYTDAMIAGMAKGFDYKGSKPTAADLPTSGNKKGDCWTTTDTGAEYIWDGTQWIELGRVVSLEWGKLTGNIEDQTDLNEKLDEKVKLLGNVDDPTDPGYGFPYHFPYDATFTPKNDSITIGLKTITLDNNKYKMTFDKELPAATESSIGLMKAADATAVRTTLPNAITAKQDKLTAGENITITDNVISATGGTTISYIELEGWNEDEGGHDGGNLTDAQAAILIANEMNYIWMNGMHRLDFRYKDNSNNLATYSASDGPKTHTIEIKLSDKSWKYQHVLLSKESELANKQDKLIAGDNITIDANNKISATGGTSVTFDEQTIIKGTDDKYQTTIGGWKETIPEQTTSLFIDTKGTGLPTFIGPGSTEQYEVGWDYDPTITSLVSGATTAVINAKFTVLGTTFNNKITLIKQTSIPASWESGDILIGGTNYKVKVYDQYTGENNGGISVISSDTGADLSESTMRLFTLVTGAESTVYHPIDSRFVNVDETSVIIDDESAIAVNPDLTLNSLTAVNNGIKLYRSATGQKQPTLKLDGALIMNSSQIEENIAEKGVALGVNCLIQNQGAFASGVGTAARGTASHAINKDNTAATQYSFASGINTVAGANASASFGNATIAKNANEAVFGILNAVDNGGVDPKLLVVGNGYEKDKSLMSADELVGNYYDSGEKTADRYVLITDANKQAVKNNSSITKIQIRQNSFSVTKSGKIIASSLSDGTNEKTIEEILGSALPSYTSLDEGKVLKIVDGKPAWVLEL